MSRSIAISTAIVAAAALGSAVVAGCNLGAVAPFGGFQDSGMPGSADAPASTGPPTACINKQAQGPDGNHNAGMACITTACHLPGDAAGMAAGAPPFIIGGTLWQDSGGTTGAIGATIYIGDGANTYTLVTSGAGALGSGAGNFYVEMTASGSNTINGGGNTLETECPSIMSMPTALTKPSNPATANDGNCNRLGCHSLTAGPDGPASPMHL